MTETWPQVSPIPRPITPAGLLPLMPRPPLLTPRELWPHLHIPNLDEINLERVIYSVGDIILKDRGRAEQVLSIPSFSHWIASPRSAKLLVHRDFDCTAAADRPMSRFSVLCAAVIKALWMPSTIGWIISLVFFCGCHLAYDQYRGSGVMIRSLITHLLRQSPAESIEADPGVLARDLGCAGEAQLCGLFAYLVRQLPPRMTVFCLIDGIHADESELFLDGMETVVLELLGLV